MKMSHKFLAVFLLTLVFSGCSSGPHKKKAVETPVTVIPEAMAAPAEPAAAQEAAPVTPAEPVEEKLPRAVLK